MKDCTEYIQNLCSYVDGEAGDSICREIEKHLKDCPECRIMVDTLKKTVVLCKEGEEKHISIELRARLESILEVLEEKKISITCTKKAAPDFPNLEPTPSIAAFPLATS